MLERAVDIPDGHARAYLQDGRQVTHIDEFTPHCQLEIRHVSGPPRTVPPGVYPVTRVQEVSSQIAFAGPGKQQQAFVAIGIGLGVLVGSAFRGDSDSPSDIFEGYHYWLMDSANVGLMRLTCYGMRAQPSEVKPPNRAEIARALGDYGRLEP